jgi:hypothetical protein
VGNGPAVVKAFAILVGIDMKTKTTSNTKNINRIGSIRL